jgi:hypothetical protein
MRYFIRLWSTAGPFCRNTHTKKEKEETKEQKTANGLIVLVALKGMIHALGPLLLLLQCQHSFAPIPDSMIPQPSF